MNKLKSICLKNIFHLPDWLPVCHWPLCFRTRLRGTECIGFVSLCVMKDIWSIKAFSFSVPFYLRAHSRPRQSPQASRALEGRKHTKSLPTMLQSAHYNPIPIPMLMKEHEFFWLVGKVTTQALDINPSALTVEWYSVSQGHCCHVSHGYLPQRQLSITLHLMSLAVLG